MPITKSEQFERFPPVKLRGWRNNETRTLTFTDEGKDVTGNWEGVRYLYHVNDANGDVLELWIAPNSPLAIGLSTHVPLNGKTFKITKTTGKALKDTRYTAEEITK